MKIINEEKLKEIKEQIAIQLTGEELIALMRGEVISNGPSGDIVICPPR
jgi:hypothetical protein